MRILLVKTSSLGDVVHNLPVVSDIRRNFPDARIDWTVDGTLAEIPRMHPGIDEVVSVAPRRWRRSLLSGETWREIGAARRRLGEHPYDMIIDTQGLIQSAVITRLASGTRVGLDWSSAREPLRIFYDRTCRVPWDRHAVERNRLLAALALGYRLASEVDYGIRAPATPGGAASWTEGIRSRPFAVLLHATSAGAKLWPEDQWVRLGEHLQKSGVASVLPWGNDKERARSERLAGSIKGALVPPRLTITEAAWLLGAAAVVVGVDTGLAHLAAALGAPTVGLYVSTDPTATGLYGAKRAVNVGRQGTPPSPSEVIAAMQRVTATSRASA
jgi:heptosyltransferase I